MSDSYQPSALTRGFLAHDVAADAFTAANPDPIRRAVLARWHGTERLNSPAAKAAFLMPEVA